MKSNDTVHETLEQMKERIERDRKNRRQYKNLLERYNQLSKILSDICVDELMLIYYIRNICRSGALFTYKNLAKKEYIFSQEKQKIINNIKK